MSAEGGARDQGGTEGSARALHGPLRRARVLGQLKASELAGLILVLIVAVLVRTVGLDSIEPNVMPDEADNMQVVYHILSGTGPGILGLSWDGQSALTAYFMAFFMRLFGMSIFAMRMGAVIPSLLSLVVFYLVARERLSPRACLIATFLLSVSLWYLNFSRNAWVNIYASLYTLLAVYFLSVALRRDRPWVCYALVGVCAALGLYSYFAGRLIILAVLVYLPVALLTNRDRMRQIVLGYGIAVAVCVALFVPEIPTIVENSDFYVRRAATVYIFSSDQTAAMTLADKIGVLLSQAQLNLRGFLLMDGSVIEGFRYSVPGQPLLDRLTATLFVAGLLLSLRWWREVALWWCVPAVNLAITQLLSVGTPDAGRAICAAPFYFLFVGFLHDRLFPGRSWYRGLFQLGVIALLPVIAYMNVAGYVNWMKEPKTADVRQPAVENWEFATWQDLQLAEANAGRWGFTVSQWHEMRKSLNVSRPPTSPRDRAAPTPVSKAAMIEPPQVLVPVSLMTAGRLGAADGQFSEPTDIAVDAQGYVYVADTGNHRIQKLDREGRFIASWGTSGVGGDPYELVEPLGVVIDRDGDVVVLDSATCWVKTYTPAGEFLGAWGGPSQMMYHPRGLTVDRKGNIWVADTGRCRVLKYSSSGELLATIGPQVPGTIDLLEPVGVAFDAEDNVYVSDVGNSRMLKLDASLKLKTSWPLTPAVAARGHHMAVTSHQSLLVTDPERHRILEFALDGRLLRGWGQAGIGPGQFNTPVGIEINANEVYVADTFNHRVQRLSLE